jgi:hypothetical protein
MTFIKGKSGNPGGRPKRSWTWAGELEKALAEQAKDNNGKSLGDFKTLVAKSVVSQAIRGNVLAIKEIMNRMDGMPSQDITSEGERITGPIIYIPVKK